MAMNKITKQIVLYITFCAYVYVNNAFASPTKNEFNQCKKVSIASLKYCIKIEPYNDNESCWIKSRAIYNKCYDGVFMGHSRINSLEKMRKREAIKKHREMYKIDMSRDK